MIICILSYVVKMAYKLLDLNSGEQMTTHKDSKIWIARRITDLKDIENAWIIAYHKKKVDPDRKYIKQLRARIKSLEEALK